MLLSEDEAHRHCSEWFAMPMGRGMKPLMLCAKRLLAIGLSAGDRGKRRLTPHYKHPEGYGQRHQSHQADAACIPVQQLLEDQSCL